MVPFFKFQFFGSKWLLDDSWLYLLCGGHGHVAASAFFFFSMNDFDRKWKTFDTNFCGIITFYLLLYTLVHERYCAVVGESPHFFR